jgi:hypothetical protein
MRFRRWRFGLGGFECRGGIFPYAVALTAVVSTGRHRGLGMVGIAAFVTLMAMSLLAYVSHKALAIGAGSLFVVLLIRFIWLVRRELK